VLGLGLWVAVLSSGVHATIAGVIFAFMIPARTKYNPEVIVDEGRAILDRFDSARSHGENVLSSDKQQAALTDLEDLVEGAGAPLYRLEHTIAPWVAFAIVPLFALANAGVALDLGGISGRVGIGVILGLVVGKQIGITLFTVAAVRLGITRLPTGVSLRQVYGASCLAGIGFTMSLFVTDLAFGDPGEDLLRSSAKLGILVASLFSGIVGWIVLSGIKSTKSVETSVAVASY
jgi:NhaA family Na+:H+ antiporter